MNSSLNDKIPQPCFDAIYNFNPKISCAVLFFLQLNLPMATTFDPSLSYTTCCLFDSERRSSLLICHSGTNTACIKKKK